MRNAVLINRAIAISLLLIGLACGAAAEPTTDVSGAGWDKCLKGPTRSCVLHEAAEVARTIGDRHSAAIELSRIAEAQSMAGRSADAAITIDQSLQIAQSIAEDGYLRDDAIEAIANVMAKIGKLDDAVGAIGSIGNPSVRARALGAIAVMEGKAGRFDEALRRVQTIENMRDRALITRRVAWDLRYDAVARGEDDKIAAALADVQAIEQQYPHPTALSGVHHASEFFPALAIIAKAQAHAGKVAEAVRTVSSVTGAMQRAEAFAAIAVELNRAGAVASALKVARAVDDRWKRGMVLDFILEPRPTPDLFAAEAPPSGPSTKAEPPNAARDAVTAFTDREQRATALAIVAVALANDDRLAEAIELAELIDRDKPGAIAWRAIAEAQVKAGLATQSILSFDRAMQAALSFQQHDRLLSDIAISRAKAGQISEALGVTRLIGGTMESAGYLAQVMVDGKYVNDDYDRRRALYVIAKAQAKAGDVAEAARTARALVLEPSTVGSGLGAVAEGLAEAGRIAEAIEAATVESSIYRRSNLLVSMAKARAAAGRIDDAKQLTLHIDVGSDRVDGLVSIAAAQAKAGVLADATTTILEAMPIARSLPYKTQVTQALLAITAQLPD